MKLPGLRNARHIRVPSLPVIVVALGALWLVRDIAYPAKAHRVNVLGRAVSVSFAARNDVTLGRELPRLPSFLPCNVSVSIDPHWMDRYGYDGYLIWLLAHEIGHCMEELRTRPPLVTEARQPGQEPDSHNDHHEAFADGWATAYLMRCGITLEPFGFPQPGEQLALTSTDLERAQACLPDPDAIEEPGNPLVVLTTLRRLNGLDDNGAPGRAPPNLATMMSAAELGLKPPYPPGKFGQAPSVSNRKKTQGR